MKTSFTFFLTCAACGIVAAGEPRDFTQILATAPLRFEPAPGQGGRFVARGAHSRFSFAGNEATVQAGGRRIGLRFDGADPRARLEGVDKLRSTTGMFLGNDPAEWRRAIPNYGRLQMRGLYRGVDLVYYGSEGNLEYDLKVQPGADARRIRLRFEGETPHLDADGNLVAELIHKQPQAYQVDEHGVRVPVESRYLKNSDGSYGFALGSYDRRRELIIDPQLALSAYIAGSFEDIAYSIGHDASGFIYVGGVTNSSDLPATGDARQGTIGGGEDVFLAKIDPNAPAGNQVIYLTFIGGSSDDTLGSMVVGPKGDVYMTGTTLSTDFPMANSAQTTRNGNSDAFVVWVDSSQNLAYSTFLGGGSDETGQGVAVDSRGVIYVAGSTKSTDFPVVTGFQTQLGGGQDAFVAVIDPSQSGSGTVLYSTYLGGSGWETGRGIAVAPDGTFWVVGGTYSGDFPVAGYALQPGYNGGGDAFLAQFNLNSAGPIYATYLGGSGLEEARNVVIDPAGQVIVSGFVAGYATITPDFPVTSNSLQTHFGGETDVFVSILNPKNPSTLRSAQLVYSTYFGGRNGDAAFDMKRDAAGNLYLAGFTLSPDLNLSASATATQLAYDNSVDAFALKITPSQPGVSALSYFSFFGSRGEQVAYGVDFDDSGNIYIVGGSSGPLFDAFQGVAKTTDHGNMDAFVAGLSGCGFSLSPATVAYDANAATDKIAIVGVQNCAWTAVSNVDWVTVSPASGRGNGSVTISVSANSSGDTRKGTVTIAGLRLQVLQVQ